MNKSFWGVFVIMLGITSIILIVLFQSITNSDEHNSQLLKEVTEAAMWDAVDYGYYRSHGAYKINKEKFVENFVRRFAQSAQGNSKEYTIDFMDINELPPKVSIRVTSVVESGSPLAILGGNSETYNFTLNNTIDAILETPY